MEGGIETHNPTRNPKARQVLLKPTTPETHRVIYLIFLYFLTTPSPFGGGRSENTGNFHGESDWLS